MLFAIVPVGQGNMSSQIGSMLAGPSVVPEAQMLGLGPEMYNCMECKYPLVLFPMHETMLLLNVGSQSKISIAIYD